MGLVLDTLNDIQRQIAADDRVLKEARDRRDCVANAAMKIEGALRWFRSGSVAHGTVNRPVTDADSGIVLDRRTYPELGPNGEGPERVVDKLCEIVGPEIRKTYPNAVVNKSRRGLYVEFNEPLNDEEDPTVDLIVALTRAEGEGLWIADRDNDSWSASHPERHTELFTSGAEEKRRLRARVTRLAKAWNAQWDKDDRALSSFNIQALAWEFIQDGSVRLDHALAGWFAYARDSISKGDTQDPARVSRPIRLLKSREVAVQRLESAAKRLAHALAEQDDVGAVQDDLATVYWDFVTPPTGSKSALADALRKDTGVGASASGLVAGGTAMKRTPSYGGGGSDG